MDPDLGPPAWRRLDLEPPAEELDALFHAQQAQALALGGAGPGRRHVKALAVVADGQVQALRAALQFDVYLAGPGVAHHVGQGFLHQPKAGNLHVGGQALFKIAGQPGAEPGLPRLAIQVPAQGGHQAQVVEQRGPQVERQAAHLLQRAFYRADAVAEIGRAVAGASESAARPAG